MRWLLLPALMLGVGLILASVSGCGGGGGKDIKNSDTNVQLKPLAPPPAPGGGADPKKPAGKQGAGVGST